MSEKIKKNLRIKCLKKRELVENRVNKEKKIFAKLKELLNCNGVTVAVYYSTKSEVNLTNFVNFMHKNQQKILFIDPSRKSNILNT